MVIGDLSQKKKLHMNNVETRCERTNNKGNYWHAVCTCVRGQADPPGLRKKLCAHNESPVVWPRGSGEQGKKTAGRDFRALLNSFTVARKEGRGLIRLRYAEISVCISEF
jgi:hypothetical protein